MKFDYKDLKDNIADVSSVMVQNIKRYGRIIRLKKDEKMLYHDIKKEYRWLGEKYYGSIKGGKTQTDISKNIENLDSLNMQLLSVKHELNTEKGQKLCPVCSASCDKSSVYCSKCGSKFK